MGAVVTKSADGAQFGAVGTREARRTEASPVHRRALRVVLATAHFFAVFAVSEDRALSGAVLAGPAWLADALAGPWMASGSTRGQGFVHCVFKL